MDRRSFLQAGAVSLLGAAPNHATGFRQRGYLGWITDLASEPEANAAWPSIRLDERLLDDYIQTFRLMKSLGYTHISVWGLFVSRNWPVDIPRAIDRPRRTLVEKLIAAAHEHRIRVLSGLGLYSWGFDEIIKAFPALSRGNPRAMCASNPEAWEWMRKVIDFVCGEFPLDGVSMQSADQGRCTCPQCRALRNAEYHALVNTRAAEYIRSRWPKKTIGVNGWGMNFEDPGDYAAFSAMGRKIDYLIDVHDTSRRRDPANRRRLIDSLACDFGTLGGPQVEPPQHWRRDRWFLPTVKRQGEHLAELRKEGGRACEYFFHILTNPGDLVSFWMTGKLLDDPATPWQKHLRATVAEVFETSRSSTVDALAQLMEESDDAYFKHLPPGTNGTISLEPPVGDHPGPPVYISKRLNPAQRTAYGAEATALAQRFRKLVREVGRSDRVNQTVTCLENVAGEIAQQG